MTRVARSIFVFGLYVAILGLLLAMVPALVLEPFGFATPREPWVRVLSVVAFILGFYYVQAARQEVMPFFRWTIWGRGIVLIGFSLLVATGQAAPALILFGLIDAAGAA